MNKNIIHIIATIVIAGLNIWLFIISQLIDIQLAYVAFIIVWINLAVSLYINKKQPALAYMFFSTALIVEALLAVNYFWIQR